MASQQLRWMVAYSHWLLVLGVFTQTCASTSFSSRHENLTEVPIDRIDPRVRSISIRNNLLLSITDNTFSNFGDLTTIDLSSNRITTISDYAFNGTRLQRLTLRFNRLTTLPRFASVGATLQYLTVNYNRLERLNSESFRGVTGLKSIDVGTNSITTVAGDAFRDSAVTLTSFNAGQNRIQNIPAEFFTNMNLLSSVNLQNNRLQSFFDFRFLPEENRISSLSMNQNSCGDLPEGALYKLTSLRNIALANNGLTRMPDFSRQRSTLTSLYFGHNRITSIPEDTFKDMRLSILNLQGNRFVGMPNLLPLNATLRNLYISRNTFGPVPCETMLQFLHASSNLQYLDISNVGLETFPDIFQLNRTFRSLRILNSQTMHCDCAMTWMLDVTSRIASTDMTASSTPCASPRSLVGRRLSSLTRLDLCNGTNTESCQLTTSPTLSSTTAGSVTERVRTSTSSTTSTPTTSSSSTSTSTSTTTSNIDTTSSEEVVGDSTSPEQDDVTLSTPSTGSDFTTTAGVGKNSRGDSGHNGDENDDSGPMSVEYLAIILGCSLGFLLLISVAVIGFLCGRIRNQTSPTQPTGTGLYTTTKSAPVTPNDYTDLQLTPTYNAYEDLPDVGSKPEPPPLRHGVTAKPNHVPLKDVGPYDYDDVVDIPKQNGGTVGVDDDYYEKPVSAIEDYLHMGGNADENYQEISPV